MAESLRVKISLRKRCMFGDFNAITLEMLKTPPYFFL
jgi:hypothetical protein